VTLIDTGRKLVEQYRNAPFAVLRSTLLSFLVWSLIVLGLWELLARAGAPLPADPAFVATATLLYGVWIGTIAALMAVALANLLGKRGAK
jgi:hypothetical protein